MQRIPNGSLPASLSSGVFRLRTWKQEPLRCRVELSPRLTRSSPHIASLARNLLTVKALRAMTNLASLVPAVSASHKLPSSYPHPPTVKMKIRNRHTIHQGRVPASLRNLPPLCPALGAMGKKVQKKGALSLVPARQDQGKTWRNMCRAITWPTGVGITTRAASN